MGTAHQIDFLLCVEVTENAGGLSVLAGFEEEVSRLAIWHEAPICRYWWLDSAGQNRIRLDLHIIRRGDVVDERRCAGVEGRVQKLRISIIKGAHPQWLDSQEADNGRGDYNATHTAGGTGGFLQGRQALAYRQILGRGALAMLAQGLLQKAVREVCQQQRNGDNDDAQPPRRGFLTQVGRGQNKQWPVPQVERVGYIAQPARLLGSHCLGNLATAAQDNEHGAA